MHFEYMFCVDLITLFVIVNAEIINPTTTNSSAEWYINSERNDGHFQYDEIFCSNETCILICDRLTGCYGTIINASKSSNLIINCLEQESCHYLNVTEGPSMNVTINCVGDRSCKGSNFHLDLTMNAISLNCNFNLGIQGNENGACIAAELIEFNFYANYAKYIDIYCGEYDCVNANFYINHAHSAIFAFDKYGGENMYIDAKNMKQSLSIDCFGSYGCKSAYINTQNMSINTNGITLNCTSNDKTACMYTFIYCPLSRASCNCGSCFDANLLIVSESDNGLNLFTAPNMMQYAWNGSITFKCLSMKELYFDDTDVIFYGSKDKWQCGISGGQYGCCPFHEGIINHCQEDTDCNIDCSVMSCQNVIINANTSLSLTVLCNDQYNGCNGAKIICPYNGQCDVVCNGGGNCNYLQVMNENRNKNNDAIVNIECNNGWACSFIFVDIKYVSSFSWKCNNGDCERNVFHIEYVKNVNIYCKDGVDSRKGQFTGCSYNTFKAMNAENVIISCDPTADRNGYGSCYSNDWYLPNDNIYIYCQSDGCGNLGDIYVTKGVGNWIWYYRNCDEDRFSGFSTSIEIHCEYSENDYSWNYSPVYCRCSEKDNWADCVEETNECECKDGFSNFQINPNECEDSDNENDSGEDDDESNAVAFKYIVNICWICFCGLFY
eukprot:325725_1